VKTVHIPHLLATAEYEEPNSIKQMDSIHETIKSANRRIKERFLENPWDMSKAEMIDLVEGTTKATTCYERDDDEDEILKLTAQPHDSARWEVSAVLVKVYDENFYKGPAEKQQQSYCEFY
jgi:hypothetical protein